MTDSPTYLYPWSFTPVHVNLDDFLPIHDGEITDREVIAMSVLHRVPRDACFGGLLIVAQATPGGSDSRCRSVSHAESCPLTGASCAFSLYPFSIAAQLTGGSHHSHLEFTANGYRRFRHCICGAT
ncbi:hypothetical protein [Nocardia sp. NPDC020380]|uniref:hypothetical protein n=1 Tax=Nocardia sp. NPDC020380 TaxID=3364309 RepID=UPI0037B71C46